MSARSNKRPSHSRSQSSSDQRGFALLITITLLAFLVLLLVSLASLTRVETQVASNGQQLSQARQNALSALNIALGQLQKYAGPDQRVTGTADLAGTSNGGRVGINTAPTNTTSVNGTSNGLAAVQPGTRYWTGIWGNSDPSNPSQTGTIYEKSPGPVLLNWMVSGNETTTFTASTAANTFGQITASNGGSSTTAPLFNPAIAPVLPTSATETGTIKDRNGTSHDTVLLVGAASASTADRTLPDGSTEKYYDRYVVAPLESINAPAGSVPGLGPTDTPLVGRYAYWIGDEGVKAKYNLADAYTANTDPVNDIKARYRLLSAQRNGIEQIGWLQGAADPANFANYPGKDTNNLSATSTAAIESTLIPGQMRLGDTSLTEANAKAKIHHLTTYSKGVLDDSYNGGLRRDLTSYLEASSLPAYSSATPYEPAPGKPIIPTAYSPTTGPNWDVLKSFYSTSLYTTAADANIIDVQAADPTHVGISPVITQVRLLVGLRKSAMANTGEALASVVLMLGNPYTATLRGNVKFKLRMNQTISGAYPDNAFYIKSLSLGSKPTLLSKSGSGGLLDTITFTISGLSIPPGEAICYTNAADVAAGTTTVPLAPGAPTLPASSTTTAKAVAIDTGVTWVATAARNDTSLDEGSGASPGRNSNIDYILTDTSGNTLTSVLGSDANLGPSNMIAGPKDGSTPGYASILILKLRPPSNYGLLLPTTKTRDWRTYCDYNIRAQSIITPGVSFKWDGTKAAPPYECNYGSGASAFNNDITISTGGNTVGYWGRSVADDPVGSTTLTQLFDAPRANRIGSSYEVPILSMGQLQHANLTADDQNVNVGNQPGNAVGNSYFNPYVARANGTPKQARGNRFGTGTVATVGPANLNYYDISYFLNCALWDRYFFSTTPPASTGFVLGSSLPNNRLKILSPAAADLAKLRDGRLAASNLLFDGAFNINSTSVDAWSALLSSTNKLNTRSETSSPTGAVFARSWNQLKGNLSIAASNGTPTNPELTKPEAYAGYRRLTSTQVTTLAQAIVKEVRNRGPFVSLAHFINRTLSGKTDSKSLRGPLQTAIDGSGLNGSVATGDGEIVVFNGIDTAPSPQVQIYADIATPSDFIDTDWGSKSTGIPGWLTQADILQSLGPVLSTRSDTFVIRTYGETRNPLDNSTTGAPLARAWCEAVVQRMPDYVDANTNTPVAGNENPATALSNVNQAFGRRFQIVSFRWLTAEDI